LGYEASGVVVMNGGGVMGARLMGKRVGIVSSGGGRMWAQYAICPAIQCIELPHDVTFEQGCSCFVNPLTVVSFCEIAKNKGVKCVLHTAGGSSLGKMLIAFGKSQGIQVIPIIRRSDARNELLDLGALDVIVTSEEGWNEKLKRLCETNGCSIGYDAVAGSHTGEVLKAMPKNSTLYVYGGLSEKSCSDISPSDLIFAGKTVTGFWLTPYLFNKSMFGKYQFLKTVQQNLNSSLGTQVKARFSLDRASDAFACYVSDMSGGKVIFQPNKQ
jgi:NADPH:quinone reductase-like Zn-dependent oxidoreductase